MLILKDREAIARIICPLAEYAQECSNCRTHSGCPDYWPDVADKVDGILATLKELGYRKPGELLSCEEIDALPLTFERCGQTHHNTDAHKLAQAQLDKGGA